jgi:hypothetical protein
VSDSPGLVVAVGSASGGCGVTTIALHLCRRIGGCFVEVARAAGAAERLGLDRTALRSWDATGPDRDPVRLAALPMAGGFRAVFAAEEWDAGEVVMQLAGRFDAVVVDLAARCPPVPCAVKVVVMPATVTGARRARDSGQILGKALLVANRLGPGGEYTRAALEVVAGRRIDVALPCCPALRDAEDDGRLVGTHTRWHRRLDELAGRILQVASAEPAAIA